MSLIALSYPYLSPDDQRWIEGIRQEHEINHGAIKPHITLVFPLDGVPESDFVEHVSRVIGETAAIRFVLKSTVIVTDRTDSLTYVLLVAEEGHSQISKLHDRLYTDILEDHRRLDMPYIPHVTVGSSPEPKQSMELISRLNEKEFAVEGAISSAVIADYKDGKVIPIKNVKLLGE